MASPTMITVSSRSASPTAIVVDEVVRFNSTDAVEHLVIEEGALPSSVTRWWRSTWQSEGGTPRTGFMFKNKNVTYQSLKNAIFDVYTVQREFTNSAFEIMDVDTVTDSVVPWMLTITKMKGENAFVLVCEQPDSSYMSTLYTNLWFSILDRLGENEVVLV